MSRKWGRAIASLLVVASMSSWGADCRLGAMTLPVKMVGVRPIAMLTLNGQPTPMLVDTGAFFSMLNESTAAQLHLLTRRMPDGYRINGVAGTAEVRLAKVEAVGLSGGTIPNVEFMVGGSEINGGAMGIIGRNFLAITDTEYDLAHGTIRLIVPNGDCEKTDMAYWAGTAPVNVVPLVVDNPRERTPAFIADIRVDGKKLRALFDTGAESSTLTLGGAESAGIKQADMTAAGTFSGIGSGHGRNWIAKVDTFEIGGERIEHSQLPVMDSDWLDQDMLLGIDYFLSHHILVARSQHKLYATWNGGAVFGRNAALAADSTVGAATDTELAATDGAGLMNRGAAFAARGDLAHALADLDRACPLVPTEANCFATRAGVHAALRQTVPALADLDEAVRLDPADARLRVSRARLRAATGDRTGATDDLRTLDTALAPASNLRASLGHVYADMDMAPEALHQWDLWMTAHQDDSGRASVLNSRCRLRTKLGIDLDLALADCRDAVDENPDEANNRDGLGWVYVRRGDYGRAVKAFDDAIARKPDLAPSFYGRAVAERHQGASAAAQADLAQARKLQADIDDWARKLGAAAG